MRFFSNEAKDNADERDPEDRDSTVQSEPVTVPQQRAGSPWQHGPDDDPERPPVHDPAPQPTAFGASTVGGAVAASAAAGPYDDASRATDRTTDAASGVADDRTVPLGEVTTDADRTVPIGEHQADSGKDVTPEDPSGTPGETDRDQRPGGDDEVAWAKPTSRPEGKDDDDAAVDVALEDHGTFDDPKVAEDDAKAAEDGSKVAEDGPTETDQDRDASGSAEPEVIATAAPTGPAPFFPTADTQAMRERWRDVQLRFVDDPKGATAEAAGLVDEAVDKLTTALRDQRGSLAKGTDDTEALRVELRSYRDILDRLLGL